MSIQSYLEELADLDQPVSATNLASLTNVTSADLPFVESTWLRLSDRRRLEVVKALQELAEDNVELNFDPIFRIALRDSNPEIRKGAVHGLWEYEGSDLVETLVRLLESDGDAGVRAEAALALGRFALKNELHGNRAQLHETVDKALRHSFEDAREPVEVRGRALESLGVRSEPWVRALIEQAYDDAEPRMRLSAVHAMGRSADPAWLPTLEVEAGSEEPEMRFEVATAVAAIGDEDAVPLLVDLSSDDDEEVQDAAIGALGEIGGDLAKEALRDLLDSPIERVRDAALTALREATFADDPLGVRILN